MKNESKQCPFCAESIKASAIVCRFCNRELLPRSQMDAENSRLREEAKRQLEAEQVKQNAEANERRRIQEEAEKKRAARRAGDTTTNKFGIKFVWCPPGTFIMGDQEHLRHKVTLTKGFYLGSTPVTQSQWRSFMTGNPSKHYGNDNLPVEGVSYSDCMEFCKNLEWEEFRSVRGKFYRLPTEAEWEYGCRAGSTTKFSFGDTFVAGRANCADGALGGDRPFILK